MSNQRNKSHSLLDAQSFCSDDQKAVQEARNRSTSSNAPTNAYVIPAQRRAMTPSDTPSVSAALTIRDWRRKAQTPTSNTRSATEPALVTRSPSTSFRPTDSVQGLEPTFTAEEKVRAGFSWRYKGDIRNPKNSSLRIAPDDNCALFLTNLPAGTTPKILLDALGIHAPFGRVHATSIAPPTDGRYKNACAKITMFLREEAVRVFQFIAGGNLRIAGRTIAVVWNSNRSAPQRTCPIAPRACWRSSVQSKLWISTDFRASLGPTSNSTHRMLPLSVRTKTNVSFAGRSAPSARRRRSPGRLWGPNGPAFIFAGASTLWLCQ